MLSRERAQALLLSVSILCVGLAVALVMLWQRLDAEPHEILAAALGDPAVKQEVVAELVERGTGIFDSHPDRDVSYVLQPNLQDRVIGMSSLSSNRWGLREREYALPKPEGTVRVVLLGDSYVHGNGVFREERLGVDLEEYLRSRAGVGNARIECLHVGMPSWNIRAACAFVRRQLTELQPDLVVHVVVPNDLDDVASVRGFGSYASFSRQSPEQGSLLIQRTWPVFQGHRGTNYLLHGIDHESRRRYAQARADIQGLRSAVERTGGRYVLVLNWMSMLSEGVDRLADAHDPSQTVLMPRAFFLDEAYRVSANNGHWNDAGHGQVALALYHHIQQHDLLPSLDLRAWAYAEGVGREFSEGAAAEMAEAASKEAPVLPASIDFGDLTPETARLVHGGIAGSKAGPRASWVLGRNGGDRLSLSGAFLPAVELTGVDVRISLEEVLVHTLAYRPGEAFEVVVEIPEALEGRDVLNVRVESDDYVYAGADMRTLVSLEVLRAAIE